MFELWGEAAVCEHSGPVVDSRGQPIRLPAESPRDSDRLLEYWLHRAGDGTGFRWAVLLADRSVFVGAVGFNALEACSEYAYHFVPRFWGDGLATEASHVALAWCFSLCSESIEAFIVTANTRSIRLVERLGFRKSGSPAEQPVRFVLNRRDGRRETDA
jgi:ribosomal-protein-alanine N-acetyltransferase